VVLGPLFVHLNEFPVLGIQEFTSFLKSQTCQFREVLYRFAREFVGGSIAQMIDQAASTTTYLVASQFLHMICVIVLPDFVAYELA
jgi:hypothetical protein